jgi:hypothetical protein
MGADNRERRLGVAVHVITIVVTMTPSSSQPAVTSFLFQQKHLRTLCVRSSVWLQLI